MSNLIAIDLGNSSSTYGIYRGRSLKASGYSHGNNILKLGLLLAKSGALKYNPSVIISSVVPFLTDKLVKSIKKSAPKSPVYVVGRNVRPKVPMKYDRRALGSDRLVNLYGASNLYKPPLLIIDFGTAITFDYLSKSGIFEGGLIVPGIDIAFKALQENTALLPKLKQIKPIHTLVGRNTKSAMYSGILNGFGALSDGLIERFRKQYGRKLTVLATGGFASRIASYMDGLDRVDPLHTVRSLEIIYQNEIHHSNS